MNVSYDFNSPEDFTTFTSETAGPLQKILANQTTKKKVKILKTVAEAARKYADNNVGKVRFENKLYLL
jgi:hypothetical protein